MALHDAGKFSLAHQALENAWRAESSLCRLLPQEMLQISVTCCQSPHGNISGAHTVLARSLQTLEILPVSYQSVAVENLPRQALALQKQ
jgi:predicted metal-dependent hydrolase